MSRVRMIMDVDTGVDDALALALAVRHPDIQLEAVLTVAGNVGLDLTTRNTLRVLDWLGVAGVPVVRGADGPLSGTPREARHWHGADGLGDANLPEPRSRALDDGVAYLIDRLMAAPGQLTLVCTAPLTNLALALRRQPSIVGCVREVVLMGGNARPPGNATPSAEFNIYADPEAAALVFQQSWALTMVGLDVTNKVRLTRQDLDGLVDQPSPEAVLLRQVTRHLFEIRKVDSIALHDPLAVGVAIDPSLVTTAVHPVQVETRGDHTLGQTVVDFRPNRAVPAGLQTRVSLDVDSPRFLRLFFDTLAVRPNRVFQ